MYPCIRDVDGELGIATGRCPAVMNGDDGAMYQVVDEVAGQRVARAQAGDAEAIAALLADLRPRVFRYCLARVGDPHLADDLTQEVTMTLVTILPRYRAQGSSFDGYVFGIAANKVSEARRRSRRRPEDPVEILPERRDSAAGPEQLAVGLDATRRMLDLLEQLPHRQAEVLRLRVAAGLSVEETAGLLGMSPNTVRVTAHRALARLRQLLTVTA
ncbi:MAG TPA: sigma-70 family RNA polymerase sigma factor [Mycobacteriales bacterium]|nr:sigma-70 family RNA polymerase sigma factor [Mycobacteriales bacterium]